MKNKFYKLMMITVLLLSFKQAHATVVTDTAAAANLTTCLAPGVVRYQFTVSSSGSTGAYVDIRLPNGFTYAGLAYGPLVTGGSGSNTITYSGVVAGRHRFTFGSSVANQAIRFGIRQLATCNAGNGSYTGIDSSFFFEGSGSTFNAVSNTFTVTSPDLSITGISTSPNPTNPLTTVTRTFTINNGGFGATRNFIAVDRHGANNVIVNTSSFVINPAGVNFSIPSAYITTTADSLVVRFDSSLCQQIGDVDQLFENGESFVLQYQFQLQSCGNTSNNIVSTLRAAWRCNTTNCVFANSSTAISVNLPAAPSFTYSGKRAAVYCYDGTTPNVDTVRVINTGAASRNFLLSIRNSTGGNPENQINRIDTANIFYKRGRNGTLTKIRVIGGTQFVDCNSAGGYSRVNLESINLVNNNDTLWFYVPRRLSLCPAANPCAENGFVTYRRLSPGLGVLGTYANACNNVTFNIATFEVFDAYDYGYTLDYNGTETVSCGQSFALRYIVPNWYFSPIRASREYEITLPPEFILDTVAGVTAFLRQGSTNYFPTARPSANVFRFNRNNFFGTITIYAKSVSASSSCSGPKNVLFTQRSNLDTASSCNSMVTEFCLNKKIQWYACTPCDTLGLSMDRLTAWRKNLDLNDPLNNGALGAGKPDSTLVNRTAYLFGDTLILNSRVIAKTTATHPLFEHAYFKTGLRGGTTNWTHVQTTVRHWGPSTALNTINPSPTFTGDSVRWDLSALPDILNNDTITITTLIRMTLFNTTEINLASTNETRWYASRVANPSISQQLGIINTRGNVYTRIIGFARMSNGSSRSVTGCTNFNFQVDNRYNTPGISWPYEIRPMSYLGRCSYYVPPGYFLDSINIPFVFALSGVTYPTQWSVPFTRVGDSIIVNFAPYSTVNGGVIPPMSDDRVVTPRFYFKPTCRASNVLQTGGHRSQIIYVRNPTVPVLSTNGTFISASANMPQFVVSSASPTAQAYSSVVTWPIRITNSTSISAPNSYVYLNSASGNITVDSVYRGSTKLTAVSGFYHLGTTAGGGIQDLVIYARNNACGIDSLEAHVGFDCGAYPTTFSSNICGTPTKLYVQAQPATIATSITPLASTPIDPSNASSAAYTNTTVPMCSAFPVQIEIQSSQSGSLFNVRERINLPLGTTSLPGLDYISDSGYIEYPIGTTPRAFSSAANTAILGQVASGAITLSLEQIDPTNFGIASGLLGTGLSANPNDRRVILRFKMRPNCNVISGNSWSYTQLANTPCGSAATGNNITNNGFAVNLTGVARPYLADVVLINSNVIGFGNNTPVRIRTEKVGATAPSSADSITLVVPNNTKITTINCNGAFCPSGTVTPVITPVGANNVYKWVYPSTAGATGDTLLYTFNITAADKSTCASNLQLRVDLLQKTPIYCGAPIPANLCPNSTVSLGGAVRLYDLVKPQLSFVNYYNEYAYEKPLYKYRFLGDIVNSSAIASAPTNVTLKTYMDVNNNLIYDRGTDVDVKTTTISTTIPASGSVSFYDSFSNASFNPSPSVPMYTVIDTTDALSNCFCTPTGSLVSAFNQALPLEFISANAENIGNLNAKITWAIDEQSIVEFKIFRQLENSQNLQYIGTVLKTAGIQNYLYLDHISLLKDGQIIYQIHAIDQSGKVIKSKLLVIEKNSNKNASNRLLNVYPNPAKTYVDINLNNQSQEVTIELIDVNGVVILKETTKDKQYRLDLRNQINGLYTLKVTFSNNESAFYKLNVLKE